MMRRIAFGEVARHAGALFERGRQALAEHPRPPGGWEKRLADASEKLGSEGKLRITLVGQYNAGKSSLIAALTGANVHIDADVATTAVSEYEWNGVRLLDTPGVQAQATAMEHDVLSREATRSADLVLFVVSTDLFSDRLAAHFQWIAGEHGLGLAGKTAVVINKMDRETNEESVIREQVALALAPHDDVPIFTCSARSGLDASRAPESLRGRFWKESNLDALVAGIDAFVEQHGMAGRLCTPIQMVDEVLDDSMRALTVDASEESRAAHLLKRKRKVFDTASSAFDNAVRDSVAKVRAAGGAAGDRCVRQVKNDATKEEIEWLIVSELVKLGSELDTISENLQARLNEVLQNAQDELDDLGETPLGAAVRADERRRADRVAAEIDMKKVSDSAITRKAVETLKKPLKDGLEHLAKNPKLVRDAVYKAGKALGKDFRPWEAVKAGKGLAELAGTLGKGLPFVAVALDAYFAYREESAEDLRRAQLARARTGVHRTFSAQAEQDLALLRKSANELRRDTIDQAIEQAESAYRDVCSSQESVGVLANRISEVREGLRALQRRILDHEGQ